MLITTLPSRDKLVSLQDENTKRCHFQIAPSNGVTDIEESWGGQLQ